MNKWLLRIVIGVLVVGAVVIVVLLLLPNKQPVPSTIKRQLGSTLLVPMGSSYTGVHDSAKFDGSTKLLSYRVTIAGAPSATVSEQPAPSQFTDIDGYYSQFISDLGEYKSFGSTAGTVYLIHPKNAPKTQVAVLTEAGTLMFVKPDANLSDSQWQAFFSAVQSIH
jgi:hypothetical protein